jgi:hypothetical protein
MNVHHNWQIVWSLKWFGVRDCGHVCHLIRFICGTSQLSAQYNSTCCCQHSTAARVTLSTVEQHLLLSAQYSSTCYCQHSTAGLVVSIVEQHLLLSAQYSRTCCSSAQLLCLLLHSNLTDKNVSFMPTQPQSSTMDRAEKLICVV